MSDSPTLPTFVESCLVPYLYAYSYFERHGRLPFGELGHGNRGILEDYMRILGATSPVVCIDLLHLATMRKRVANKRTCPCGSGLRVGKCHCRQINGLREKIDRGLLRSECEMLRRGESSAKSSYRDHSRRPSRG
jgi:hypothetical protein